MKIETILDHQTILENRRSAIFFAVRFQAPEFPASETAPAAYCLAIDQSASVDECGCQRARRFVREFIRHLPKNALLSIVTFNDSAEAIYDLAPVTDKGALAAMIDAIEPGDFGTNLSAGILLGREQLRNAPAAVALKKLILLTDGEHTTGIREDDQFARLALNCCLEGIAITTMHLGDNNPALLAAIAHHSGGNFYNALPGERLHETIAREIGALQPVAAQNVRLRMKPLDLCERVEPLGMPEAARSDGWLTFSIGDVLAGEDRTLCFNVIIPLLPCIDDQPCATLANEALLELEAGYEAITANGFESKTFSDTVRVQPLTKTSYPPPGDGTFLVRDGD